VRRNHDRWLVSYSDFVTLLFALFVVMFAAAESNIRIPQDLAVLARAASSHKAISVKPTSSEREVEEQKPAPVSQDLARVVRHLNEQLRSEIQRGQMSMQLEKGGLVITLSQAAFFPSGGDRVEPGFYPSVLKVANAIRGLPNAIRLEGHTDSQLLHQARFRDNWDLSAARALAMLRILNGRGQIDGSRLAIAGYADTLPLTSNETERGRARNRRVDIVILNLPREQPVEGRRH
jgi:chemotaxis protein MotB